MVSYKVFNHDFTCNRFQFELGKTYVHEGEVRLCESGFHFCEKLVDCFSYYPFDTKNIVCEVLAEDVSEQKSDDSKRVCRKITIVRQMSWQEVCNLVNSGKGNTGLKNSGHRNSGYCNSGNYNSGNYNSGNYNSGDSNSGYFCRKDGPVYLFDSLTMLTHTEVRKILSQINLRLNQWIYSSDMSDEEKSQHPEHTTT